MLEEQVVQKTSITAWIETAACIALNSSCAIMWMTASSTPTVMSEWLNISFTQLNWLSNASAICNTIVSLLTPFAYDRMGIKSSIIACGVLNSLGCWIRTIAILLPVEKRFAVFMTGQFIASLGGPLVYNLGAKFVSVWFAPKDRGLANTLLSVQIGMALGPLILPLIAPTISNIPRMLIIISSFSTLTTLPTFFIPKQPRSPPSVSATIDRTPFWEGVRAISKNIQFWWLALIASISMGTIFSVSVLIMEAIGPFGYTEQEAGLCAASVVFAGCLGGCYWIGKNAHYFMFIKMLTPIVIFTYVMYIFNMVPNAFPTVLLTCILNGFFAYALIPVYMELAAEVTYPVSESIGSCILWASITLAMLLLSILIDALRAGPEASPPYNMKLAMIVTSVIMAVTSIV
ncbi:unnamed protein product [Rhizopus stolonifer]